jgi:hypothetical protein
MKIKLQHLPLIILFLFIIILIIYLLYINNMFVLSNDNKEGFVTNYYRPFYRKFKRELNKYFKLF